MKARMAFVALGTAAALALPSVSFAQTEGTAGEGTIAGLSTTGFAAAAAGTVIVAAVVIGVAAGGGSNNVVGTTGTTGTTGTM